MLVQAPPFSLIRNVLAVDPPACDSRRGRGRLGYSDSRWIIIQFSGREYYLILAALTNMVSILYSYGAFVNQRTSYFNIQKQNS